MSTLTVIGVGNRLRADDAVGPLLIDELSKLNMPDVELIDAGSDALGVLEYLEQREHVIIIDACSMGKGPGTVITFAPHEADMVLDQGQISLHGLGLAEALKMGEALKMLPKRLKIIGIEPLSIQLNGKISPPVLGAMKKAMDHVHREVLNTQGLSET